MNRKTVVLAAGGTGGHLFPAYALTQALTDRGYAVDLMTDERAAQYGVPFPGRDIHLVTSATVTSKSPAALLKTAISLSRGIAQARSVLGRIAPAAVLGFGGYPTFPPLTAARLKGIPTALHEANAVLGRANRMLAKRLDAVALTFEDTKSLDGVPPGNVHVTGMPVRANVVQASARAYEPPIATEPFELAVFGGSQGARYFSDLLPQVVALLSEGHRARLRIVQQCRPEDLERVRAAYDVAGVRAELAAFFTDLPERLAAAHLVIARAGASTVAELTVLGRPAILVPLPGSLDNDQLLNAQTLQRAGACWCMEQAELTADDLAQRLAALMDGPETLEAAARAARHLAQPAAVDRLADLVERLVHTAA